MGTQRQPTKHFLQRVKNNSEATQPEIAETRPSLIRRYKDSDAWLWTEVAAVIIGLAFIIPTAIALWIDLDDRKLQREALRLDLEDRVQQRIAQAWETVIRPAPGNSGKGPALEYLRNQGIELVGIDLSTESNKGQSYLVHVNLSGAGLGHANFSGANLFNANLSYAVLGGVNLTEARLWNANLSGAYLREANLSKAELQSADLSKADFWLTNLSGAKLQNAILSGASNLSQKQLDNACGDENTLLPNGLTIKNCP